MNTGTTSPSRTEHYNLRKAHCFGGFVKGETLYSFGTLTESEETPDSQKSISDQSETPKSSIQGIVPLSLPKQLLPSTEPVPDAEVSPGKMVLADKSEEKSENGEDSRRGHRPLSKSSSTGFVKQISDENLVFQDHTDSPDNLNDRHSSSDQQSSLSDQQSSLGDKQSSVSDQQSSLGDKQSSLSDQQSSVSDQQSSVSDQQSSVSDQQSSISDQQSSVSDQQNSVSDQQNSVSDQQSSVSDQQSRISDQPKQCP